MPVLLTNNHLLEGDALNPDSGDVIVQEGILDVGEPLPVGWNVLTGNNRTSRVARVALRHEIEE